MVKNELKSYELINGMKIPCIGYGTFPYKAELIKSIPIAASNGYELIDTSDDYHNYEFLGEALKNCDKKLIVEMKISWPFSPVSLRKQVMEGKKQLKLNDRPIDILLIHFPYPHIYVDAWKEMEKLYREGECRAIGVCNFEIHHLKKLMKHCEIMPMIDQFELHPLFRQEQLCDFCSEHKIAVMSYCPVCRMNPKLIENTELKKISKKYGKSVIQVILRWNYQHNYIPIPASSKSEHIISNIDIFDFELSQEDMKIIDGLECGMRIRYNPNTMYTRNQRIKCLFFHIQYIIKNILKIK